MRGIVSFSGPQPMRSASAAADLVLIEPGLVLRRLEGLLHHPPLTSGDHPIGQGGAEGVVAQEVGDLGYEFAVSRLTGSGSLLGL